MSIDTVPIPRCRIEERFVHPRQSIVQEHDVSQTTGVRLSDDIDYREGAAVDHLQG